MYLFLIILGFELISLYRVVFSGFPLGLAFGCVFCLLGVRLMDFDRGFGGLVIRCGFVFWVKRGLIDMGRNSVEIFHFRVYLGFGVMCILCL